MGGNEIPKDKDPTLPYAAEPSDEGEDTLDVRGMLLWQPTTADICEQVVSAVANERKEMGSRIETPPDPRIHVCKVARQQGIREPSENFVTAVCNALRRLEIDEIRESVA